MQQSLRTNEVLDHVSADQDRFAEALIDRIRSRVEVCIDPRTERVSLLRALDVRPKVDSDNLKLRMKGSELGRGTAADVNDLACPC